MAGEVELIRGVVWWRQALRPFLCLAWGKYPMVPILLFVVTFFSNERTAIFPQPAASRRIAAEFKPGQNPDQLD
ncbi:MAG: hypothetical protein PHY43_15520 [Verrucomicrobiales bacterium]|nr:hypothetical protein [Verrucomicrobiales bacterium]